jgi:hypothetical protein
MASPGLIVLIDAAPVADVFARAGRRPGRLPPLIPAQILSWADAHHARTGVWPAHNSGPIAGVPGETWSTLNSALRHGGRSLPGGDSLVRLLRREGRIGERRGRPPKVGRHLLVRRLRAGGLSATEIGRRLGISRQAAWEMLKKVCPGGSEHL